VRTSRLTISLLVVLAASAHAQDLPPPGPPPPGPSDPPPDPPDPPVVAIGPADVRTLAEEVGKTRVAADGARIVLAPATAVGEEFLWLAPRALPAPVPPELAQARGGAAETRSVRVVVKKDRSLILQADRQ
jgi:hypothetical protein